MAENHGISQLEKLQPNGAKQIKLADPLITLHILLTQKLPFYLAVPIIAVLFY